MDPESVAMPDTVETRQAVLEAQYNAHVKSDDERYGRIDANMERIATAVASFGDRLEKGFTRVHERIDEEAGKVRNNINNQAQITQALVEKESARALEAEGVLEASVITLERGGNSFIHKALWAALGTAASSAVYLLVYGPPWDKTP